MILHGMMFGFRSKEVLKMTFLFEYISCASGGFCMGRECYKARKRFKLQHVIELERMMQALPIFLDKMFNEVVAVLLSVTFVLAFGEVSFC